MLTFTTDKPHHCGIVEVDAHNVLVGFHEKVDNPPGNKANAAIYIFESSLIDELEAMNGKLGDFSVDILPRLLGRIYTCHTNNHFIDIGTQSNLVKAQSICRRLRSNA